jgi:hypothetical protein
VVYCISYELRRSRNCPAFFSVLSTLGARQLVGPVWLVESSLDSGELLRMLMSCLERDDSVAVMQLKAPAEAACWNVSLSGETLLTTVEREEPVAGLAVADQRAEAGQDQDRVWPSRPAAGGVWSIPALPDR